MIFEHILKLPLSIRGFVREDAEGNQHIYYNSACVSRRTFEHERRHIENDDLRRDDVEELR